MSVAKFDPFATRYDSDISIGGDPFVEIIGRGDLVDIVGFQLERESELTDIVGAIIGLSLDVKLPTAGDAIKLADQALSSATKGKDRDAGVASVTDSIRSVTRSPILAGALAATAAVVPIGTIVAGIGAGAIAVAEGVMGAIDEISKLFGGGESPEERWARLIREEREKYLSAVPDAKAEIKAQIQKYEKVQADLAKLSSSADRKKKLESELNSAIATATRNAWLAFWVKLAPIAGAAAGGDAKAKKELVAIQTILNADMQQAIEYTRSVAAGFSDAEAKKRALERLKRLDIKTLLKAADVLFKMPDPAVSKTGTWYGKTKTELRELMGESLDPHYYQSRVTAPYLKAKKKASEQAKKDAAAKKKPAAEPDAKKVSKAVSDGAKKLEDAAKKAAALRGPVDGVLVATGGKRYSGRYEQKSSGNDLRFGALVRPGGRVFVGKWANAS